MKTNLKRMAGYYKPYLDIFIKDMIAAFIASIIALIIPLTVRYITRNIMEMDKDKVIGNMLIIGGVLLVLIVTSFNVYAIFTSKILIYTFSHFISFIHIYCIFNFTFFN